MYISILVLDRYVVTLLPAQVALIILVPEPQLMMPRVLRCDLEGVRTLLHQLESESNSTYL